jgi:diguanylate cyclase (GGDEF)-like protein
MSFRNRLTGFFVLIVVLPMIAVGFLVFRLIGDTAQGKADARASGVAAAAADLYNNAAANARLDAKTLGRALLNVAPSRLEQRATALASQAGLARVTLSGSGSGGHAIEIGNRTSIAPGSATVLLGNGSSPLTVTASEMTAGQFAHQLLGAGVGVVVRQAGHTLGSTIPSAAGVPLPKHGRVTLGGTDYRVVTQSFPGFGGGAVQVTAFSNESATSSSVQTSKLVAALFIAGFLLLAFLFSVTASRQLQGQLGRFLGAARRLGGGDFTSRIPTEGHDEFAALGEEFNSMSAELERHIQELQQERGRLRESIRRIGQTFASNLDRKALLDLALGTAIDAVQATSGRMTVRAVESDPLSESGSVGSFAGIEEAIHDAERYALASGGLGEACAGETWVMAVALGTIAATRRSHGVITVARHERAFTDDDRDVLRSLASQTTLALENVELHFQVQRQAVTDELTGLANHGRFQELLTTEIEQVRRYEHPVGLIMLDIDDFKSVNDTYGHQQGDVALRQVARVLRDSSRDADAAARYGGEEMALILPHTDMSGSYAIAERVRTAIEGLHVPRLDGQGTLRITASLGVAASADGDKDSLISEADGALYAAKRSGKNRTVMAQAQTANVFSAE